jgi:hypothetical protein
MKSGFRNSTFRVKKFERLSNKILSINFPSIQLPHLYILENSVRSGCLFLEKVILQNIVKSLQQEDIGLICFYPETALKSNHGYN